MVSLNHQLLEELRLRTQLPPSVSHGILVYKVQFRHKKSFYEVFSIPGGARQPSSSSRATQWRHCHPHQLPGDQARKVDEYMAVSQAIYGAGDIYKVLEGSGDLVLTITRDMRTFTRTVRPELPQA